MFLFFFFFNTVSHAHGLHLPGRLVMLIKARCQICDADGRVAEFYGPSSRRSVWPRRATALPVVQMNLGEDRPPRRPARRAPRCLPSPQSSPPWGIAPSCVSSLPMGKAATTANPSEMGWTAPTQGPSLAPRCDQLHPEGRPKSPRPAQPQSPASPPP